MSAQINQNDLAEYASIDIGDSITPSGALDYVDKSIRRVNRKLRLSDNEITVSASGIITAPDEDSIDILLLQMECLIVRTDKGNAISKGIKIKSGSDSVDTTAGFSGYESIVKDVCGELERAVDKYLENVADTALTEGGSLIWYGEQREYWESEDYDNSRKNFRSPFDDGTEMD
mgnify:CR=1 FL=1